MSEEAKSVLEEMNRPVLRVLPADDTGDGLLSEAMGVVRDLASAEDCAGGGASECRIHRWQHLRLPCPHQRAKALLARWETTR